MEGTVKRWVTSYGFIEAEGIDKDIFVHESNLVGVKSLNVGQKVKFEIQEEDRGPKAVNVEVVE